MPDDKIRPTVVEGTTPGAFSPAYLAAANALDPHRGFEIRTSLASRGGVECLEIFPTPRFLERVGRRGFWLRYLVRYLAHPPLPSRA